MTSAFKLTKRDIFRDSKVWYLEPAEDLFSKDIINFCKKYAGKKILDFGCATGAYCLELKKLGFEPTGVDVNERYIEIAKLKGVDAYLIKDALPFTDGSFDTVILIEVLEHLQNPGEVLKEAKRVARKNILIGVPNCEGFERLGRYGLTYEHFLDVDHVNFFTEDSLKRLLSKDFSDFKIIKWGPIYPFKLLPRPFFYYGIGILYKLGILKPNFYKGLFAVVNIKR